MSMSAYSRRRAREEYQKYMAWYNTLTAEEKIREDERREREQLKGFLYIMLGLGIFVGLALLSDWMHRLWPNLLH